MALTSEQWKSLEDMAQQIGRETIANGLGSPQAQGTGSPSYSENASPRERYNQLWEIRKQQAAEAAESAEQREARRERVRSNFLTTMNQVQEKQSRTNEASATPVPGSVQAQNLEFLSQYQQENSLLARLKKTGQAAVSGIKDAVASNTDAQRALYEAGQSGREARMQEDLKDLEERLAEARRAYGQLREQVDLGNRDFTERDVQDKADQIKQLEVQISGYKKAPEAQRGATEETSKLADEVKRSAEADIERAKKGRGKLGSFFMDAVAGGTQLLGDIGAGAVTGGGAMPSLALRSFGGGTQQARQAGASLGQQIGFGAATATVEMLTEKMADGLAGAFGKGAADDVAEEVIRRLASTPTGQTALRTLYSMGGEGVEEIVSELVSPALKAIYDKGESAKESYGTKEGRKALAADALYSGLLGAALGAPGSAVNIATGRDAKANAKNQELTDIYKEIGTPGIKQAVKDRGILENIKGGKDYGNLSIGEQANEAMEALRGRTPESVRAGQLAGARNRLFEIQQQRSAEAKAAQAASDITPRSAGTQRQQENRAIIMDMLDRGRVSNTQAEAIIDDPGLAEAFKEFSGYDLQGTREEKRTTIQRYFREQSANRAGSEEAARLAAEQAEAEEARKQEQREQQAREEAEQAAAKREKAEQERIRAERAAEEPHLTPAQSYVRGLLISYREAGSGVSLREILKNAEYRQAFEQLTGIELDKSNNRAFAQLQEAARGIQSGEAETILRAQWNTPQTPQNAAGSQEAPTGEITPPTAPNAQGEAGAQPQAAETAQEASDKLTETNNSISSGIDELIDISDTLKHFGGGGKTDWSGLKKAQLPLVERLINLRCAALDYEYSLSEDEDIYDRAQSVANEDASQSLQDELNEKIDLIRWAARKVQDAKGNYDYYQEKGAYNDGKRHPNANKARAAYENARNYLERELETAARIKISLEIQSGTRQRPAKASNLKQQSEAAQEWEQKHQQEAAAATEPEAAPEASRPVETESAGTIPASEQTTAERTNGQDERGYTGPLVDTQDRVFETQLTDEEKQLPGLTAEEARHIQHHDAEVDARAKARIAADAEQARAELLSAESWSDEDTATAGYLIQADLDAAGNAATEQERANIYKRLAELKKQWNKQGTEEGRALRQRRRFVAEDIVTSAAETLYGNDAERGGKALRKLKPQAKDQIMRTVRQYAQRFNDIQKNHPGDVASIIQLIKDVSVQRRTTGLFSNQNSRAVDFALEQVAQQEGGVDFLNDLLTTQIKSIASDYIKPGIIDQLKSFRFMNMLSNLATVTTNLGANTTFGSIMEPIASAPSAMMDSLMEHFTGQRTVPLETVKQAKTGWNGFRDAGLRSFLEVTLDAEAEQASYGYKEIKGSTFKMVGNPLERFLATMQKWQGYALKSTDQAAKGSARAKVSEGLNRLADRGRTNADNIDALAEQEAKYRTLQTEGKVSNALYAVRKAADDLFHFGNDKTGKYGLGTDIMPFAQVPANAVSASLEAHPVIGGAKAVADTLGVIHDAINGESVDPEKQARAARAWGRAANGAAVAAAFAALAARGHIRDKEDDDKNVQAQRRAEGQGTLQLNVSSALRDITGQGNEARDGDTYIDFSWVPQLNLLANFGVDLYNAYRDNGKITMSDIAGASWDSLADSIMEFPAVSKVSSLIQTWKYSDNEGWARLGELAATSAAETASSVLIPNAVRAAAAGADPYERDVYNTDTYGEGIRNNLIAGIPGLRQTLPERLDTFGNPVKNSGGTLHFLDKTAIPGNVEVDNRQSAESKAIENLIKATGDKSLQPSRNAPGKLTIGGESVELSAKDKRLYQQTAGQLSQRYIGELMKDDIFKSLSPEDQAAAVKELYSAAKEQAKSAVADSLGKKNSPGDFQKLLSGVVNPGNGTDNDIPKLQGRNVAQYTSYNVAYKNAVKRGDTEAIDNLLMRYGRLNGNTQAVIAAKNPESINNLLKYSQAGVKSQSYFTIQDAIDDAQIELDKSGKTGGDVQMLGLASANIPESEKAKLIESGAFKLSKNRKAAYDVLTEYGYTVKDAYDFFEDADYSYSPKQSQYVADGTLSPLEVAAAIQRSGIPDDQKAAAFDAVRELLQGDGGKNDTWVNQRTGKPWTYQSEIDYIQKTGYTYGKGGSVRPKSSGNVLYDYYAERAKNAK